MAKIFKPLLIINLAIVLLMFFSTPSRAENEIIIEKPSSLQIGMTLYRFDYKEDLIMPDKSTEYGWMPGVYLDYTYKKKSTIYAKVFLSYAANEITYDGSNSADEPVKFDEQKAQMFKFETNVGYPISLGKHFMLYGEMTAYYSYIGDSDTDFKLGNRIGAYAEIPITYKFTNEFGIVLTPWYEYGAFGRSDWEYIGGGDFAFEPASRTHKYGA